MANEKRLIDADSLEKDIRAYADNIAYYGRLELAQGVVSAVGIVNAAPTVDAVPVVRCKGCEYAKDMLPLANATEHELGVCTVHKEDGIEVTVWGHGFCSLGERREGE